MNTENVYNFILSRGFSLSYVNYGIVPRFDGDSFFPFTLKSKLVA